MKAMNVNITHDIENLLSEVTSGQIRAGAKLITRIEWDEEGLAPILRSLYRAGGRARIIGITGPPGSGKSTLIDKLVGHWRGCGACVAVLAVDPSSPITGGAVLGDRLRMSSHSGDDGVFIRSMASRGRLGGLARVTGDAITVLDAMPWDVILVETVGVGQNETDIMRHASVVVLLQTPMGGDGVQASKAGITEIGDIYVVNKSDHPDADCTARQLEEMIALSNRLHADKGWRPPVVKTQAVSGAGISDLALQIDRCFDALAAHPESARARLREQAKYRVGEIVKDELDKRIHSTGNHWLDTLIDPVLTRDSDPYTIADELLARMA